MAPSKKSDKDKKGCSALNEMVTRKYTKGIHKCIHGVDFKNHAPQALKECLEIFHEGKGNSRCVHCHQAQQSCLGQRNKECPTLNVYLVVQNT